MSRYLKTSRFACLVVCACAQETPAPTHQTAELSTTPESQNPVVPDEPNLWLMRTSMAIRGIRPSLADYERLEDDWRNAEDIVDQYLDSHEFGKTVRDYYGEVLLTDVMPELYPAGFPAVGPLSGESLHALNRSVIEAAPRLVEYVVKHDRPFGEILLTDEVLANRHVATVWGLPYDENEDGWQVLNYTDGRPPAGILSDGFLFTRHSSTIANRNRGRASQIASALLCYSFAESEVEVGDVDLSNTEAVREAVTQNPTCVSCHQSLDPMASFFAAHSFIGTAGEYTYPIQQYDPGLSDFFPVREANYFGQPGEDLGDLAWLMSQDSRFYNCAAKRLYARFMGRDLRTVGVLETDRARREFSRSGYNYKALAKTIVMSPSFAGLLDDNPTTFDSVPQGVKRSTPAQLADAVQDLTGFRWQTTIDVDFGTGTIGDIDLMTDVLFGFRVLAGGPDLVSTLRHMPSTHATSIMVLQGLAQRAAPFVVQSDFAQPKQERRKLLRRVGRNDSSRDTVTGQLQDLHLRLFGQALQSDHASIDATWQLFQTTEKAEGAERAWETVLYAMLSDFRMLYY